MPHFAGKHNPLPRFSRAFSRPRVLAGSLVYSALYNFVLEIELRGDLDWSLLWLGKLLQETGRKSAGNTSDATALSV